MAGGSGLQQVLVLAAGTAVGVGLTVGLAVGFRAAEHAQREPGPRAAEPRQPLRKAGVAPKAPPPAADAGATALEVPVVPAPGELLEPGSAAWQAIDPDLPPAHRSAFAQTQLRQRFTAPQLVHALLLYHQGQLAEARAELERFAHQARRFDHQSIADTLARDLTTFEEKAERARHKLLLSLADEAQESLFLALAADDRLMAIEATGLRGDLSAKAYREEMTSVPRAQMLEEMNERVFTSGRQLADRGSVGRACLIWATRVSADGDTRKLAAAMKRFCAPRAKAAQRPDATCDDLLAASAYLDPDDGSAAAGTLRRRTDGCMP